MDAVQYGVTIQIKPLWQNFCMVQLNRNSQPPVLNNHLSATSTFLSWETAHTLAIFIKHLYNNHLSTRGGSRIFFRRGCTRLLLYFNTNKPHSFFLQNTSCIRKPQVISEGGVHPLHPPPRSAPVYNSDGNYKSVSPTAIWNNFSTIAIFFQWLTKQSRVVIKIWSAWHINVLSQQLFHCKYSIFLLVRKFFGTFLDYHVYII